MPKAPKATQPLDPVQIEAPIWAYDKAVKRAKAGEPINMPCAFDHEEHLRAAGTIVSMKILGADNRQKLEDFELQVKGRVSGSVVTVKLLAHHVQIYHSFSEADEDVEHYRKARGL